jgi:hypothetical protein
MDRTHYPLVSVMLLLAALAAMAGIAPSSWTAGVQAVNGCNSNGFSYSTAMLYLPESEAAIVIEGNKATNFSNEATDPFFLLAGYLFPEQLKPAGRQ